MTTGRINQVTLVKKKRKIKSDRSASDPLNSLSLLFSSPNCSENVTSEQPDQEVLLGLIVWIQ